MKYSSTFVLNLSRQRISLGMISNGQESRILDSFDPNEPAGNQSLKRLFFLAKALSKTDPIVEVILPNDIIQNETFISEDTPSMAEIKSVIKERSKTPNSEIEVALGEKVGSRAVSIAFAETAVLEELRNFINTAGFKIKCFRARQSIAGFNKDSNLFPKYSFKPNKLTSFLDLKYVAAAIIIISGSFLFLNSDNNFYESVNSIKSTPPKVNSKLILEQIPENIDAITSAKNTLGNIYISNGSDPKKMLFQDQNIFPNLYDVEPLKKRELPNFPGVIPPILISKPGLWFREYDLSAYQVQATPLQKNQIIKEGENKVPKLSTPSFKGSPPESPATYFSSIPTTIKVTKEFQKRPISSQVKLEKFNKYARNIDILPKLKKVSQGNTEFVSSEDISKEYPELNDDQKKPAEFELLVARYTLELMPYKKPIVIDNIKILSEPTLSTGALVFLKSPLLRPDIIIQSKQVKLSQVSLTARATRSPSIPKNASIWHNSTRTNFIDLDRTNLIGILGKSSNPRAMIRLSNGTILTLKVGDGFQGWRVFAIDRDKIHVENGSRQEILHLPG